MKISDIEKNEYSRYLQNYDFKEYLQNKTLLITGSNGMTAKGIIQWILLENILHDTNCKIVASTRHPEVVPDYVEENDFIEFCKFGTEMEIVRDRDIDYIIQAAAPTGRAFFISKPVETLRIIVDETEKMLEIAKNKKAKMVFLSSVEAYGVPNSKVPLKETYVGAVNSLDIRNGYPMGKKAAEFLCYAMNKEYGVDVKIVRPSSIQGLLQPYNEQRIFNEILRCMIENKNLVMKSDGMSKKSIVYTLDAVTGILIALFKGEPGEAYNITNPSIYFTMKDLTQLLFGEFRPELKIVFDIKENSKTGYLPHLEFTQDISKLRDLGWEPITDLKTMYQVDLERFGKKECI